MPYASNGQIGHDPIAGGIEISEAQYAAALEGMQVGHIVTIDGGFRIGPAPIEPELREELTFEQRRARQLAIINGAFERDAAALTAGYPETERLTWMVQQQEAMAWGADAGAATPYLDGLAAARGIDAATMRAKTLQQVQLFMSASQALVGKRQRLRDLIDAVIDGPEAAAQFDAITWEE